jgi:hypothetical protein
MQIIVVIGLMPLLALPIVRLRMTNFNGLA